MDFEGKRCVLSSKLCKKLGDDVVTVRAAEEKESAELCMQSALCGGGCDMPKAQSAEEE